MKTRAEVHTDLVMTAADDFLTRLRDKAEEGLKTPEQVKAFTCRIERAVQLIEEHPEKIRKVCEGSYQIISTGKNPNLVYGVGQTCTCPDADPDKGKAPGGWCKHKLAVYLLFVTEKQMKQLSQRVYGLPVPHDHTYQCGHDTHNEECWDNTCENTLSALLCADCRPPVVLPTRDDAASTHVTHLIATSADIPEHHSTDGGCEEGCDACQWEASSGDQLSACAHTCHPARACQEPEPYHTEQYEVATPYVPKGPPLPPPSEALSSCNIEGRKGDKKVMWTLRSVLPGAAGDEDIIARLPRILGVMQKLGITFPSE